MSSMLAEYLYRQGQSVFHKSNIAVVACSYDDYTCHLFCKKNFFSHFLAKEFFTKNRGAKNEKKILLEKSIFQGFES